MKRICKYGHDTFIVGRDKYNGCKVCRKVYSDKYYEAHKDKISEQGKKRYLYTKASKLKYYLKNKDKIRARRYNLTLNEYNELMVRQNSSCAICRTPDGIGYFHLSIDHDHQTGKVRGLLCSNCNIKVLSTVENYPHLISAALQYLKNSRKEEVK